MLLWIARLDGCVGNSSALWVVMGQIYPSEFGKERLKMEETQAPPELRALPDDPEEDNEEEK